MVNWDHSGVEEVMSTTVLPPAIANLRTWIQSKAQERNRSKDSRFVFEYSDHLPDDVAYMYDKHGFEDRRYRVMVHTDWQEQVEAWATEAQA